jgi:hypothetical protein
MRSQICASTFVQNTMVRKGVGRNLAFPPIARFVMGIITRYERVGLVLELRNNMHCLCTVYALPIALPIALRMHCLCNCLCNCLLHYLCNCLWLCTASALPMHCPCTPYALFMHCLCTVYALPRQCLRTVHALPMHCLRTA